MSKPLAIGLGLGAAVVGARLLQRLWAKYVSGNEYDGLDGVVSYSSRKIAASRAMEDDEDNPLVSDPLAAPLAGRKALAAARARRQPAPAGGGRAFKVGAMAVRTRWFDDQLEACLGMPLGAAAAAAAAGDYIVAAPPPGRAPRQVVVLGAGMDSRPWRLKLPAGLAWFEVDRADVLAAKQAALGAAGAELGAPPTPSMRRGYSSNALLEAKIGSMDHHPTAAVAHPLRAESWVGVAADLGDPAWAQALAAAGFEPGKPTVWIAEGLLMYLEAARVSALLQEVAASSAPGSALLTMSVTEDVITDLREQGTASELMATWRFGCPRDPTQWLVNAGWAAGLVTTRAKMALALRLAPELCAFEADPEASKSGRSLFIAAFIDK